MADLTPAVVRLLLRSEPGLQLTALKAVTNLVLDTATVKVQGSCWLPVPGAQYQPPC